MSLLGSAAHHLTTAKTNDVITRYSDLPCGGGKTLYAIRSLTSYPQQSILAVDRREVIPERVAALQRAAQAAGTTPLIVPIFSTTGPQAPDHGPQEGVRRMIRDAAQTYASQPHVILIVTHAGLMMSDLGYYDGWQVWIDEVPNILESVAFRANRWTLAAIRSGYDLDPVADGVSTIRDRRVWTLEDMTSRDVPTDLRTFHAMAMTGEARIDAASWDDVADRDGWIAWRINSLADRFAAFSDVAILGDAFSDHTTGQLLAFDPSIELQRMDIPTHGRVFRSRSLRIEYFDDLSDGSSRRFKDADFDAELAKVADYIRRTGSTNQIITTNNGADFRLRDVLQRSGVEGQYLSPLQAGSNSYSHIDEATMLYTAKPSEEEVSILSRFGLTREQIIDAREHYAVNQFLMRTSARDAESERPIVWRVWGRACAEYLARKIESHYPFIVTVEHVDLGVTARSSKPNGRPRKLSDDERRASRAQSIEKQKAKRRVASAEKKAVKALR